MEVQDSSVINVVIKEHKRQIKTAHESRIMQFEIQFTADHGGKFLNISPSFGKRHWTLA